MNPCSSISSVYNPGGSRLGTLSPGQVNALDVSAAGYREAGRTLGGLGVPTVFVQEGGYDLATIGELVRETLLGFEAA